MKHKLLSTLLVSASVLASGQVFAQTDTAKPAAPAAATPAPEKGKTAPVAPSNGLVIGAIGGGLLGNAAAQPATATPKKAKKAKKPKAAPVAPSNAAQRNNGPL